MATINYIAICSNDNYDFYVAKLGDRRWFTYAWRKGTPAGSCSANVMAGFTTKRVAVECAHCWQGWVGI